MPGERCENSHAIWAKCACNNANGGIVNMGIYGGTAEAGKSYFDKPACKTIVAGDVNGDCAVDFKDFRLMALHWLDDYATRVPEFFYYYYDQRWRK